MKEIKISNFIRVLVFNIIETIIIFFLGNIFNVNMNIRIMFMVIFFLTRMLIGSPKHYNKAYKCALWSSLVFLSLYSLSSLDILAIILLTIFTGFISTGKADIEDGYMWKSRDESKYKDIEEFVKYNSMNDKLIEFEKKLKEQDSLSFLLYKYRFKDNLTFAEISERLDGMSNPRITEKLDKIAFSIRIYCII